MLTCTQGTKHVFLNLGFLLTLPWRPWRSWGTRWSWRSWLTFFTFLTYNINKVEEQLLKSGFLE